MYELTFRVCVMLP